jgi:hypothetical protein
MSADWQAAQESLKAAADKARSESQIGVPKERVPTVSGETLEQKQAWNAMSAFANCGRAVAQVRGSYVPTSDIDHGWRLSQRGS